MGKMRKKSIAALTILVVFLAGWSTASIFAQKQCAHRIRLRSEEVRKNMGQQEKRIKLIGRKIYGDREFSRDEANLTINNKQKNFIPSNPDESVSLEYLGGMNGTDRHWILTGDGNLFSEVGGKREFLANVSSDIRDHIFHSVIDSGILNFPEGVLSLKKDILRPDNISGATDFPMTKIRIHIPELDIDKNIIVGSPEIEQRDYPDIIEFRIIFDFEKDMLSLIRRKSDLWEK